jgi:hypothetical protein
MKNWNRGHTVLTVFALLVSSFVVLFGLELGGLQIRGFFGEERAKIERNIFKKGTSHIEGMAQDLVKYKYQYMTANGDVEKVAIASLIRDSFADFDANDLKSESLRTFLSEIMNGGQ